MPRLHSDLSHQGPDLPMALDDAEIVQMGNNELILVGGDDGDDNESKRVLSFTLGNGWVSLGSLLIGHEEHGAVLVPAGSVKCNDLDFELPTIDIDSPP